MNLVSTAAPLYSGIKLYDSQCFALSRTGSSGIDAQDKINSPLYSLKEQGELIPCIEHLQKIKNWPENWDGYNAERPKKTAIAFAETLIRKIFYISYLRPSTWTLPNISSDSDGNIMLEWWGKDDKKITLYVNENNQIDYIKSSSRNIIDMEDGTLNTFDVYEHQTLFDWLYE